MAKAVSQTQNAINTDPNLSGSDKQSRLTALKTAQENAQNAINTATSPAQADSTLATGSDFNKATQAATDDSSVTPLATQKSNAANQLDNDKAGVDAPINNDSTLSPAEQAAEVQAANNILDQAKTTAANAADADSVANAVASAVQAANALHDTKTGLLNQLDQEATNTISNLQKNKALTAAQEGQLEQNVKDALAKARTAVAAAPDAASAQNAAQSSDFANALQAAQQASDDTPTLSAQAGTDGATLANLVQQAKNALTGSNASAQGAALDQLLGQMKDDLAKQTDADAMAKELAADTAAINGMNAAKAAAISTLADKAQAADKALDANVNLTDDERQDRKNAVAAALATATDAVNQATSADTATAESNSSDYADDLANATSGQGVKSLADRQADATRALQVEETVLANKIDNDPTLTAAERQAQKDALAQATAQAGQAITNAGNATAVENSLNLATQTLDTLQATKQADRASLAADYQSATAAIKQNDTLTDAQKADRQAALDKAYQAAKDGLNADQSTTGVQADPNYTGFATAKNTATDFSAVPSLADQKVAAKKTLAQAEVDAEAEVQKDPSLDAAAKTRQIQALEAALTTAESNLDQQANAQDITDYTPAASKDFADMNQTKAQGRQTLNTDAANQIAAINNDSTLSADQKQAEIQSVQAALAKALAKIDDGQDVPAIKAVLESADVQANVVTGHHPAPANQAAVSELARTSLEPAVTPKLGAQPAAVKAQTPATKAAQPATRVEKHGDKDHAKKAPVAQKATGISQKKLIDAGFLTSAIGTMAWGFAKRYKKN
ncbi:putative cell-wall-anchored protein SasC with LPXTG motif [Fructobacillus ficulneus]|uniref:Putative cell-wall-anchored protein SasC with LPXTG motif n=1 Tax=Fructobacillus ficulneus TaxID=157463 RepID=A0A0K8MIM3_9LACO|nr:putative cell-wall-anchored protein SasC with LPXTG motif [Fructobacillus ficulneus]